MSAVMPPSESYPNTLREIYLLPGELHCASEPTVISTVLGSCVAVCLWDKTRRVGGMNHFVLPHDVDSHVNPRYGDAAIDQLKQLLLSSGSHVGHIKAKVFGGANVLPVNSAGDTVGRKNIELALERLRSHGIPLIAQATGGVSGYMIKFNSSTGQATIRKLDSKNAGEWRAVREAVSEKARWMARRPRSCGVDCDYTEACSKGCWNEIERAQRRATPPLSGIER